MMPSVNLMWIGIVLLHSCELHQCFPVLVFGTTECCCFQIVNLYQSLISWLWNPAGLWSQHQDWMTLTYIINVYKSVFHVKRCKTILKCRFKSSDNCTKANCGMSGLTKQRNVAAAFCLSKFPKVDAFTCPKSCVNFIYRPVVPLWHSLMPYTLHTRI